MESFNKLFEEAIENKALYLNNEPDNSFNKEINTVIDTNEDDEQLADNGLDRSFDESIIALKLDGYQEMEKNSSKNEIIKDGSLEGGQKHILYKAVTRLERVQISKLLQMIKNNATDEIKAIILSGIPNLINYSDINQDYTPLGLACKLNSDLLVALLLELGACVNAKDCQTGGTALMQAVKYGHQESVTKLLNAKADVNLTDFKGESALFYAIEATTRHENIIKILLQNGADTNAVNYEGTPLLVSACQKAQHAYKACNILINHGVDVNAKDMKTGRTALMSSAYSGSFIVCNSLLLAGAKSDDVLNVFKSTALHDAASRGHLRAIQVMSGYNVQFNATNWNGNTALHIAAASNRANVCKFLVQRGCNPKKKNRAGLIAREVAKNESMLEAAKECQKAERFYGKTIKNAEKWRLKIYDFICANQEYLISLGKLTSLDMVPKDALIDFIISKSGNNFKENNIKKALCIFKEKTIDIKDLVSGKKYVNKKFILSAFIKDYSENKKEKSTDCDSALIPLLCVHG